jgi:serine O-acetyltransferase
MALFEYVKEDIRRYLNPSQRAKKCETLQILKIIYDREELWAILTYRFGRWVLEHFHIPILKKLLIYFYDLLAKVNRLLTGINIWLRADIGKGLYIGHYPVIIGPVKMGEYCNVSANCVIGLGGRGSARGAPVFGSRVFIGPNSVVIGKIKIGNNAAIGANAVVTKDVPDNAVVVGNPSKIINYDGSDGYIELLDEDKYI